MATTEMQSAPITRAAERYLEQYGEPMVMNTYLKITVLVLAAVCLMLGALAFRSQTALTHMRPLIIRVSDVGHADAIDYRNYAYSRKRRRTSTTSRDGRRCTFSGTATPSRTIRWPRSTFSTRMCSTR